MSARVFHIILVVLVLTACDKTVESPTNLLSPETIRSYDDQDVLVLTDATAGEGVVMLTFIDVQNLIRFKLINNDGDELWTIETDLTYLQNSNRQYVQKVIFEDDDLITVFYNNGRIRYNMSGEEVSREENFCAIPWTIFELRNIILGPQGEYLLMGEARIGGSRAALLAIDRSGNELFTYLYTITSNGTNAFTGAVLLDDGTYLVAGSYTSPLAALSNAYFVTRIGSDGEEHWTVTHPTTEFHGTTNDIYGRDLIQTRDGHFVYVIDGWGSNLTQLFVQFDQYGDETGDQQKIDFADVNLSYGTPPFIGTVIANHGDGHIFGVMNAWTWVLPGGTDIATAMYIAPHYAYFYQYSLQDNTWKAAYLDRNYSNYLSAVTRLSNGKILMAGTILSLGADMKIIITIQ